MKIKLTTPRPPPKKMSNLDPKMIYPYNSGYPLSGRKLFPYNDISRRKKRWSCHDTERIFPVAKTRIEVFSENLYIILMYLLSWELLGRMFLSIQELLFLDYQFFIKL